MSNPGSRQSQRAANGRAKAEKKGSTSGVLRSWGMVLLVAIGIWAVFFGAPAGIRYLKAPPISESFGIEDAVVALRLDARDTSYLVLVNEAGETRSVQLEERGFENSGIAWSDAGLSTGGPTDEYLLHADGLTELALPDTNESFSERSRFATDGGFAVFTGSAENHQLAFVNAESRRLTAIDAGYTSAEFANCDGEVVMLTEDGVRTVTPETRELDGLGLLDGLATVVCDDDKVYGLGEISDEEHSRQAARVWDRSTGEASTVEIRYPESLTDWNAATPFVHEGRLYWAADWRLWSIPIPCATAGECTASDRDQDTEAKPQTEAVLSADLGGFVDDYDPVVGGDDGVLAQAEGRVFGVAEDDEFINPRRRPAYDKLLGLAIFSADVRTGERRIEIEIDDIDFPRRDLHVHAIAVDPEWAAAR